MQNARLDEAQARIKITGRNLNNLRYADDTTLMAESEEELKILLMKVKEESETVGLKLNTQKTKIMASGPITFIKKLLSSSLSAISVVSSAYLRLIFLLAILIPVCASSSPAFLMMYSAYKLNKQGDNTILYFNTIMY